MSERKKDMGLEVALSFADWPRRYDTLQCPADTKEELYEALRVIAAAYRQALTRAETPQSIPSEREEIVAWLRGETPTDYTDPQYDLGMHLADAIERGEHLEKRAAAGEHLSTRQAPIEGSVKCR
jgi:hypothetical protein